MGRERIIHSFQDMVLLGRELAAQLPPSTVLALSGDLGSGKTTFVQGLALGLQISSPVQSPTFTYLNQYEGTFPLFHFDLYRMKNFEDFLGMGFDEYFACGGICAVEWPERIESILPENAIRLSFAHEGTSRIVRGLP